MNYLQNYIMNVLQINLLLYKNKIKQIIIIRNYKNIRYLSTVFVRNQFIFYIKIRT